MSVRGIHLVRTPNLLRSTDAAVPLLRQLAAPVWRDRRYVDLAIALAGGPAERRPPSRTASTPS